MGRPAHPLTFLSMCLPSCPLLLSPQVKTLPLSTMATEWNLPVATATTWPSPSSPSTLAGCQKDAAPLPACPLPSSPAGLLLRSQSRPHDTSSPLASTASVCPLAATVTTPSLLSLPPSRSALPSTGMVGAQPMR